MKQDDLLHKWVEGSLTEEEALRFREREEYADLQALREQTDQLEPPWFDKQAMLQQILATPKEKTAKVRRFTRPQLAWAIGIAASILIISIIFWPTPKPPRQYLTQAGETLEAQLPDGSTFALNESSLLSFDASTWEEARNVQLSGEASFSVEKGSPFTVATKRGLVEVLGTEFDVKEEGERLSVSCREGVVAVFDANGQPVDTLYAGKALMLSQGQAPQNWDIPQTESADWQTQVSRYERAPIAIMMEEIQARFGLIVVGQLPDTVLKADIPHTNLQGALSNVLFSAGVEYELSAAKDTVFIKP